MIGPGKLCLHGQIRLQSPTDTTLANADEYYKIAGTFINGERCGFEIVDNKLKYTGPSGMCFHLSGNSDVSTNHACQITYSLYVNGILYPGAQTPHTFPASARISSISITAIIKLNQGDELEVYAKSDTLATVISVSSLGVVCWS